MIKIVIVLSIFCSTTFAQQTINITKNSKLENISVINTDVKEVHVQRNLVPFNPNVQSKKTIEKLPGNTKEVENHVMVNETKSLVPIQEKNAFSTEKKMVHLNPGSSKSTSEIIIMEPVILTPYQKSDNK